MLQPFFSPVLICSPDNFHWKFSIHTPVPVGDSPTSLYANYHSIVTFRPLCVTCHCVSVITAGFCGCLNENINAYPTSHYSICRGELVTDRCDGQTKMREKEFIGPPLHWISNSSARVWVFVVGNFLKGGTAAPTPQTSRSLNTISASMGARLSIRERVSNTGTVVTAEIL